jgi:hypothetical protein
MSYCIFCDTELGPDTTEEHILHDCLGGRETASEVLCSHHNNVFGGTIDDAFAFPLLPIRNLMQFKSGKMRLAEMETEYRKRAIPSEFGRIVDDTIALCGVGYGDDLSKEFIGRLADRAARFALGLPYEEALSPDEINNLLAGKPPR